MNTISLPSLTRTGDIFINRCEVATATDFHRHSFIEIAYVADGTGIHTIGDNSFPARRGDITIINCGVPHRFVAENGGLLVYNCVFTPAFLDSLLTGSHSFHDLSGSFLVGSFYSKFGDSISVHCSAGSNAGLLGLYSRMLEEYEARQVGYKEMIRGLLIELLVQTFRARGGGQQHDDIVPIIGHVSRHYREELRVAELAAMGNLSPSAFSRRFKQATGCTLTVFLQRLRIEECCNLLLTTDKSVTEIAGEVGYSDMKHFYAVFRKVMGMTPRGFKTETLRD